MKLWILLLLTPFLSTAQVVEYYYGTLEDYELDHKIKKSAEELHKIVESEEFLSFLVSKGHDIDYDQFSSTSKDIVYNDIDVFEKEVGDVPGGIFQIWLVELNILGDDLHIQDTAAFSVFQATKDWITSQNRKIDLEDEDEIYRWLKGYNHSYLTEHLISQLEKYNQLPSLSMIEPDIHEDHVKSMTFSVHVTKRLGSENHHKHKSIFRSIPKLWGKSKKYYLDFEIILVGSESVSKDYADHHHIQLKYLDRYGEFDYFRVTTKNIFDRHVFSGK